MVVKFKDNEFLYAIFSEKQDRDTLIDEIKEYYNKLSQKVEVSYSKETNEISISYVEPKTIIDNNKFQKLINEAEKGLYKKAKRVGKELLEQYPTFSDTYRILGQIAFEEKNIDEAVSYLIDALRLDPRNSSALTLMGNIYLLQYKDVETALTYFNQVIANNPNDNIALNNIGGLLTKIGNYEMAEKYYSDAYKIDPEFPNTLYGMALLYMNEQQYEKASLCGFELLKSSKINAQFTVLITELLEQVSAKSDTTKVWDEIKSFKKELEEKTGKEIILTVDNSIPVAAKIEYAENYDREYHLVKYKEEYPSVEHLILHELTHLKLADIARKADAHMLFVSNGECMEAFERIFSHVFHNGLSEQEKDQQVSFYIQAINQQLFNTPLDLFVEKDVYTSFADNRLIQFVNMKRIVEEGVLANTREYIVKMVPADIMTVSKTLNLVNAIHLKSLFGFDMLSKFKATNREMTL